MPVMPLGDPGDGIAWLQGIEASARVQPMDELMAMIAAAEVDAYWKDLGLVLLSWRASKDRNFALMALIKGQLYSDAYKMFLVARLDATEDQKTEMGATQ